MRSVSDSESGYTCRVVWFEFMSMMYNVCYKRDLATSQCHDDSTNSTVNLLQTAGQKWL